MTRPQSQDGFFTYTLLAVVATAGIFYVNIMAAMVDGLVTGLGLSAPQAGAVASANVYGASAGALGAVFLVHRVAWRPALAVLLGLLAGIDAISCVLTQPGHLMAARALHGLVGGATVGIAYSVMAKVREPDRAFGVLLMVQYVLGGLGVMIIPDLVPRYGTAPVFLSLIAVTAAALAALLPLGRLTAGDRPVPAGSDAPPSTGVRRALVVLLALFLFQAGNMGLGAFMIGLGQAYGLARVPVASMLGVATWMGAAGALWVAVIGSRMGRRRPLLVAYGMGILANLLFLGSSWSWIYFGANVLSAIVWSFVVPYLFGIASALDRTGRMATVAGFASKLGLATGPLLGGWFTTLGYPVLVVAAVAAIAVSGVLTLIETRRTEGGVRG